MKHMYCKIVICYFILVFFIPTNVNSQSMINKYWRPYFWFVGVNAGISQTALSNPSTSTTPGIDLTKKNSFLVSVEAGYLLSKYYGISTGLGFSPYFTQLSLNQYSNTFNTIDSENETYERRIVGNNIKENQRIYFLEIPVMLNFFLPMFKTNGFYLQTGLNMSMPIIKTYSSTGIYSYSGYYPAYNVTLNDIPYEGFKSNIDCKDEGDLRIKRINPELVAVGGYYFYPDPRVKMSLGLLYKRMLTDISDYSKGQPFHLSIEENQIRSLMEGSEKTTANSVGIMISLRYFIK